MRYLKYVGLLGLFVLLAGVAAPSAHAQVRFGVGIGVGPAYVPAPGYAGSAGLPVWLLWVLPIRLRALRILRPRLFRWRRFHRGGSVVSSAFVEATTGLGIAITGAIMTAGSVVARDSVTSVVGVNSSGGGAVRGGGFRGGMRGGGRR